MLNTESRMHTSDAIRNVPFTFVRGYLERGILCEKEVAHCFKIL